MNNYLRFCCTYRTVEIFKNVLDNTFVIVELGNMSFDTYQECVNHINNIFDKLCVCNYEM